MEYELSSTPSALRRHRLDAIAATTLSLTRRDGPDAVRNGSKSHLMETTRADDGVNGTQYSTGSPWQIL